MNLLSTGPAESPEGVVPCPRIKEDPLKDLHVRALATQLLHRVGCPGAIVRLEWATLDDYLKHVLGHLETKQGEGISNISPL